MRKAINNIVADRKQKYKDTKIIRRNDNSYDLFLVDPYNKKLTLHGNYDTFEDAHDEEVDLHTIPSQAETIQMLKDLMGNIKTFDNYDD